VPKSDSPEGNQTRPAEPERVVPESGADAATRARRGGLWGLLERFRAVGREVGAVARGKFPEPGAGAGAGAEGPDEPGPPSDWKVRMMHAAAERLRGAADSYVAAKLDEIEARVDAKLDHVERRIDAKIVELHRNLREMRDRELRHRLRILRITLILTVLVAVLSLGYKWFAEKYFG
jgi:hypothetical protein